MPEHPQSTPPPRVATPPRIAPAAWEDFPVFRETFLFYFTEPPANAALRVVGRLFHELVLEYYHHWPEWPEGVTATELRAALADLRHLRAPGRQRGSRLPPIFLQLAANRRPAPRAAAIA